MGWYALGGIIRKISVRRGRHVHSRVRLLLLIKIDVAGMRWHHVGHGSAGCCVRARRCRFGTLRSGVLLLLLSLLHQFPAFVIR
jgi:hypothetical protein